MLCVPRKEGPVGIGTRLGYFICHDGLMEISHADLRHTLELFSYAPLRGWEGNLRCVPCMGGEGWEMEGACSYHEILSCHSTRSTFSLCCSQSSGQEKRRVLHYAALQVAVQKHVKHAGIGGFEPHLRVEENATGGSMWQMAERQQHQHQHHHHCHLFVVYHHHHHCQWTYVPTVRISPTSRQRCQLSVAGGGCHTDGLKVRTHTD